jgi:hypothetical protein
MTRLRCFSALLALVCAAAPVAAGSATRGLAEALRSHGRAEATLAWSAPGPPGAPARTLRGALALQSGLARLDVPATRESITLRADGGEWSQPGLGQFLLLTPRHAVAAMRWWRVLAGAEEANERALARGRWRLVLPATPWAAADSAEVTLDARGLPASLVLGDGVGGTTTYRVSGWRFSAARGAGAFRLRPPPGVEPVELP